MLNSKLFWFVKLKINISIAPGNFVVRPRSVAMMLASNKDRNFETESYYAVFKSGGVSMLDEILY